MYRNLQRSENVGMKAVPLVLLAESTYSKLAVFLPHGRPIDLDRTQELCGGLRLRSELSMSSVVASCLLNELDAAGEAEFGVDVSEVGFYGPW